MDLYYLKCFLKKSSGFIRGDEHPPIITFTWPYDKQNLKVATNNESPHVPENSPTLPSSAWDS